MVGDEARKVGAQVRGVQTKSFPSRPFQKTRSIALRGG